MVNECMFDMGECCYFVWCVMRCLWHTVIVKGHASLSHAFSGFTLSFLSLSSHLPHLIRHRQQPRRHQAAQFEPCTLSVAEPRALVEERVWWVSKGVNK